jgi:hypothetical protein
MLSDTCRDFLHGVEDGNDLAHQAAKLEAEALWYSRPPYDYGPEISALQRAARAVSLAPNDSAAIACLTRLARAVQIYHETPPYERRTMVAVEELEPAEREKLQRLIAQLATAKEEMQRAIVQAPEAVSGQGLSPCGEAYWRDHFVDVEGGHSAGAH